MLLLSLYDVLVRDDLQLMNMQVKFMRMRDHPAERLAGFEHMMRHQNKVSSKERSSVYARTWTEREEGKKSGGRNTDMHRVGHTFIALWMNFYCQE